MGAGGIDTVFGATDNIKKKQSQIDVVALSLPVTSLFQFQFPALLRESTRAAERGGETISNRVSTNTIALADVLARAKLGTPCSRSEFYAFLRATKGIPAGSKRQSSRSARRRCSIQHRSVRCQGEEERCWFAGFVGVACCG
jgi:hypothetical protein